MVFQVWLTFKHKNSYISFLTNATLKSEFEIQIQISHDNAKKFWVQ